MEHAKIQKNKRIPLVQGTRERKEAMRGAHGVALYNRLLTVQEKRSSLPDMNVFLSKYPCSRPIECRKDRTTTWIWFRSQTDMFKTLFPGVDSVNNDPLVNCIVKNVSSSGNCFGWQFRFASKEPPPLSTAN